MANVNLNPTSDIVSLWIPSAVASHYTLIDEGMSRPVTTDYVYADAIGLVDTYGFTFADNGEDILSLQMRIYAGGALPGCYNVKLKVSDGVNDYIAGTVNPSEGSFKEGNATMYTNPFTGAPWTWAELESGIYKFSIESALGDGTNQVQVATMALLIVTEVPSGNQGIRDGLINIR